jgi:hypothetical protein
MSTKLHGVTSHKILVRDHTVGHITDMYQNFFHRHRLYKTQHNATKTNCFRNVVLFCLYPETMEKWFFACCTGLCQLCGTDRTVFTRTRGSVLSHTYACCTLPPNVTWYRFYYYPATCAYRNCRIKVAHSSETMAPVYQTARLHISEGSILYIRRHENVEFCKAFLWPTEFLPPARFALWVSFAYLIKYDAVLHVCYLIHRGHNLLTAYWQLNYRSRTLILKICT